MDSADISGVLYGSRLVQLPHVQAEVHDILTFLKGGSKQYLEVGFDHGYRLLDIAERNPTMNVLGLEVRKKRVSSLRAIAETRKLGNLKVWRMDARTVVQCVLPTASVDWVDILFPTPWWDRRKRAKRLLMQSAFLDALHRVIRPNGVLRVQTDVIEYAQDIERLFQQSANSWRAACEDTLSLPICATLSRRQRKCAREGVLIRKFCYVRQDVGYGA